MFKYYNWKIFKFVLLLIYLVYIIYLIFLVEILMLFVDSMYYLDKRIINVLNDLFYDSKYLKMSKI